MPQTRRRPNALILLGALLACSALGALWWFGVRPSAKARAPRSPRQVTVRALWFTPGEGAGTGGASKVVVGVEPNEIPGARVEFVEGEAQGTGETWRASAWMATAVASLTAQVDLFRYVPSFTVEGRIDGPSAGGLLAAAVLACLTEAEIRPDATLTGTISPDGSIGPVGGLSQKIDAAAAAGLKLVLIPAGQRTDTDLRTGETVDAIERGRLKDIEVVEVEDVTEAYARLTGRRLRQPPTAGGAPALADSVGKELQSRAGEWLTLCRDEMAERDGLRQRLGRFAPDTGPQDDAAEACARRAEQRLTEGRFAPAYDQAVLATLQTATTLDLLRAAAALQTGGTREAARVVAPREDRAIEIGVSAAKISDLAVPTVDGQLATADALGSVAQAAGLLRARKGLLAALKDAPGDAAGAELAFRAATLQGLDRHLLRIAEDRAVLVASQKGAAARSEAPLRAWATTMERSASANLGYFQAVAIDETARTVGVHPDVLRHATEYGDLTYLMAQASLAALPDMAQHVGGTARYEAAVLGASVGAYAAGSALVSKFCSLQVQVSPTGEVTGIADAAALDRLLAAAQARALRDVSAARNAGLEATVPSFYYLIAAEYAAGDTDERLEALQCYWHASLYARLAPMLAK